jgi:hypothetical protein
MANDDAADAARFRWLCDQQGLGFSYHTGHYGISVATWGDWPDDLREAVDAARNAQQNANADTYPETGPPHDRLAWCLRHTFAGPDLARAWVNEVVPGLGNRRPVDLMIRGELEPIITLLISLLAGTYV